MARRPAYQLMLDILTATGRPMTTRELADQQGVTPTTIRKQRRQALLHAAAPASIPTRSSGYTSTPITTTADCLPGLRAELRALRTRLETMADGHLRVFAEVAATPTEKAAAAAAAGGIAVVAAGIASVEAALATL